MIWTNGVHQSAKFQTFDCSGEISPNLYFDKLLLLQVYKISAKKVRRSYVSWHWRVMRNLKKNWFVISKMTRIWWIWTEHSKVSKICTLTGSFCAKYITFDLKRYIRVVLHDTEEWCKIWRKTDGCGLEMTWGIWQIFTIALESRNCMNWKFTEELYVITLKNDEKFEEELTCHFKIEIRNLTSFNSSTRKSSKLVFQLASFDQII